MKKRKTTLFGVFILVCVFMLTGCTSREERQKANEYEEKAEPYLTQYLGEHYPNAVSDSIEDVTYVTNTLFYATYATSVVRMTYTEDGEEYHIFYDVDTNLFYEDRTHDEIVAALWEKLQGLSDFSDVKGWEISYQSLDKDEGFPADCYREGEDTLDELLNGDYGFTVTVKYEELQTDLWDIDLSVFDEDWNLTFLLTDYVENRYNVDSSEHSPYAIRQYRKEVFKKDSSGTQESVCRHYDRMTISDMEFVWPSDLLEVSASLEDAPHELVPGAFSGATFTSTDGVQVHLYLNAKTEDFSQAQKIYVFFPMERQFQRLIMGYDNSGEYDTWKLEWKEDDHIYRWFTVRAGDLTDNSASYTFGYYEMEE